MSIKIYRSGPDNVFERRIIMPYGKDVGVIFQGYQDILPDSDPFDFANSTFLFELYADEYSVSGDPLLTYLDADFSRSQSDGSAVDDVVKVVVLFDDVLAAGVSVDREGFWRVNRTDSDDDDIHSLLGRGVFILDHK